MSAQLVEPNVKYCILLTLCLRALRVLSGEFLLWNLGFIQYTTIFFTICIPAASASARYIPLARPAPRSTDRSLDLTCLISRPFGPYTDTVTGPCDREETVRTAPRSENSVLWGRAPGEISVPVVPPVMVSSETDQRGMANDLEIGAPVY